MEIRPSFISLCLHGRKVVALTRGDLADGK